MSTGLTPQESFEFVASVFGEFDKICKKWGVTKIETIGELRHDFFRDCPRIDFNLVSSPHLLLIPLLEYGDER